jgi:hypothetical protein
VIATAPTLTAMYVSAAERGGGLSESLAAARAYATARAETSSDLLRDVLASPPAIDRSAGTEQAAQALPRLREAIRTLERHTADDEEVNQYKRFVYSVAEAVAHAHREGGFLGIGGEEVSEREQAALDEIAAIFDQPRTADVEVPLPRTTFSEDEAREAGSAIGIDWDSAPFDAEQFRRGMEVELEHGRRDPATNVTDDDTLKTAKIALAHLNELPDYYDRLAVMEGEEQQRAKP